jgi:toxin YoeB
MNLFFTPIGWQDLVFWFNNPRILKKIDSLVNDIANNGPEIGIGKPEKLKYYDDDTYSRRIDEKNRLVYRYDEGTSTLFFLECRIKTAQFPQYRRWPGQINPRHLQPVKSRKTRY